MLLKVEVVHINLFYFEIILLNEKCKKVIYYSVNKNNINPTSVYKWNDERSSHGLANICIQNVFEKIV